jgi:maltose 6'-phosphate phosphatase
MPLLVHPGLRVQQDRSVHFQLHGPEAHTVRLAADFTRWSTSPLALHRNGRDDWEADTQPLGEGVHFYKYIVDGRWIHDPSHPMVEPDGCGGWNSVFGLGGPSLGRAENLRIATLNLRTYQESDPLLKLEQTAFALAAMNIDAVALQEVGEHISDGARPNAGDIIRTRLQELTGQQWTHVWRMAHMGFDVYREGVGLLVAAPLDDVAEYRLSQGRLARNALAATVTLKGVRLRLISTHCTWGSGGGLREMQTLIDNLRSESGNHDAVLLAGVLNTAEDEPQMKLLLDHGFLDVARQLSGDGNAFSTATPQPWQNIVQNGPGFVLTSRIDYQLLRKTGNDGLRPLACVPIFNGLVAGDIYQPRVSDHIGVLGVYSV